MNTLKIRTLIAMTLYFIMFMGITVACGTNQGMMDGNGYATMNSWNWLQILVSLGIGFFIGFLVFRRKK